MHKKLLLSCLVLISLMSSAAKAFDLTPLLNLKKPTPHVDTGWAEMLNEDWDIIDNAAIANGDGINGRLATFTGPSVIEPTAFSLGAVALLTSAQTLTNKTIDSALNTMKIAGTTITGLAGNTGSIASTSGALTNGNFAAFDSNGNVVDSGVASAGAAAAPFSDATALVKNASDATKLLKFSLAGLTTATTRTLTVPDASDTLVLLGATQTLTGKTYDTAGAGNVFRVNGQAISSVSGNTSKVGLVSGAVTDTHLAAFDANGNLVDSGLILATRSGNTTKAMTGSGSFTLDHGVKIDANGNLVDSGALSSPHVIQDEGVSLTARSKLNFSGVGISCVDNAGGDSSDCTVAAAALPLSDGSALLKDNSDNTKLALFELSGITTATTRTYTLPNRSATVATTTGTPTTGNCAEFDSSGNIVDAGDVCGSGSFGGTGLTWNSSSNFIDQTRSTNTDWEFYEIMNTNTGSSAGVYSYVITEGDGDARTIYLTQDSTDWSVGVDGGDAKFKIQPGFVLDGATNGLVLTDGGVLSYIDVNNATSITADENGFRRPSPSAQSISGGGTITANACGGLKRITSASAVTTSTTNTFSAPAAGNDGCVMQVCNENASDSITLDDNTNFHAPGGADVVLAADACITVGSSGASGFWRATSAMVQN